MAVDCDDIIVEPKFGILRAVELDRLRREFEASRYSCGVDAIVKATKATRLVLAV